MFSSLPRLTGLILFSFIAINVFLFSSSSQVLASDSQLLKVEDYQISNLARNEIEQQDQQLIQRDGGGGGGHSKMEKNGHDRHPHHHHNKHHNHHNHHWRHHKQKEEKKKHGKHPHRHPSNDDGKSRQQNADIDSVSHRSPLSNMVFHDSKCSNPKTSKQRPNGCVSFLNCNINGPGGWNPPQVTMNHLKMLSLQELAKTEVFQPCKKYMGHFESVQNKYGIPGPILAAIALQESTCSKTCRGPNGEIGLMQLTPENCKEFGVNPGDAWDVETNIILGAKQFKQALEQHNDNVILALGYYNGWHKGLTESQARSKKYGCFAQNNLDYLDQTLNAWLMGKDGYTKEFQTYNNLAECG